MLEPKRKLGLIGGLIIQTQPAFLSTIRADIRCTGFPLVCEKGRMCVSCRETFGPHFCNP